MRIPEGIRCNENPLINNDRVACVDAALVANNDVC